MNNPTEIRRLSQERLDEAEILYHNSKVDGAFYLSGYSVELALKAKICEKICIPNLFDETDKSLNMISGISDIRRTFKTHNLFMLLILCGLKDKFEADKATNKYLYLVNSLIFEKWNETMRYKSSGLSSNDINNIIESLKEPIEGLLTWIKNS
jgi:hypothetical protein